MLHGLMREETEMKPMSSHYILNSIQSVISVTYFSPAVGNHLHCNYYNYQLLHQSEALLLVPLFTAVLQQISSI